MCIAKLFSLFWMSETDAGTKRQSSHDTISPIPKVRGFLAPAMWKTSTHTMFLIVIETHCPLDIHLPTGPPILKSQYWIYIVLFHTCPRFFHVMPLNFAEVLLCLLWWLFPHFYGMHDLCMNTKIYTGLKTNIYISPLKIGWKTKFPSKMVPFQGTCFRPRFRGHVNFRGVL